MSDTESSGSRHENRSDMEQLVGRKERRRLQARRTGDRSVWFGLGMFGVIGWSIAVPMILGITLGLWVDAKVDSQRSWTLMLMVAGLGVGCLNAWTWVRRESPSQENSVATNEQEPVE